jgi:hypothetical protein
MRASRVIFFTLLISEDKEDKKRVFFLAVSNLPSVEKIRDLKASKIG